jgi:hypothetical protein
VLTNRAHDTSLEFRVDVIGGVLLITAPRTLAGAGAERLEAHLAQVEGRSRPVVVDLSRTHAVDDVAIAALREAWRELGDRLRVVAAPGSEPAKALRSAGLRRFAIHASLSGALTQASA